jgi:uncharacterized SAM-binding protein YcdF (DUF218 family)
VKYTVRSVAVVASIGAVLAFAFSAHILSALGGYLEKADPLDKADIALVLDGDGTGSRILTAAKLVRDGYAPKTLVSGASANYGLHSCDLAIPFAVKQGYPEAYFEHLESSARSTEEEARFAVAALHARKIHRVLLVTSNYHTRRATGLFRKQAPDIAFIAVAAPDEYFSPGGWWHSREGRKTFLYEWEKTVATWMGI